MTASLTAAIQKLIDAQAEETRIRDARIAFLQKALEEAVTIGSIRFDGPDVLRDRQNNIAWRADGHPELAQWLKEREGTDKQK